MTLFHLALRDDWDRAVDDGSYRTSTLGATLDEVGYLHASHRQQVAPVAERFYAEVTEPLVLLVIDEDCLAAAGVPVVEEDGGDGEEFPHLYAALATSCVRDVVPAIVRGGALVTERDY